MHFWCSRESVRICRQTSFRRVDLGRSKVHSCSIACWPIKERSFLFWENAARPITSSDLLWINEQGARGVKTVTCWVSVKVCQSDSGDPSCHSFGFWFLTLSSLPVSCAYLYTSTCRIQPVTRTFWWREMLSVRIFKGGCRGREASKVRVSEIICNCFFLLWGFWRVYNWQASGKGQGGRNMRNF